MSLHQKTPGVFKTAAANGFSKQQTGIEHYVFGKLQPQALALEETVLGALMLDRDALPKVRPFLRIGDFYRPVHGDIYEAICFLYDHNDPVDMLTVTAALIQRGQGAKIEEGYLLVQLTNKVASAANIEYHARILYQLGSARQGIKACNEATKAFYEADMDVFQVFESLQKDLDTALGMSTAKQAINSTALFSGNYLKRLERLADLSPSDFVGTGLSGFDGKCRFRPGDLICVAARPGMGKSALVGSMALNMYLAGKRGLLFTLEMSENQFADRMVAQYSDIELSKFKSGAFTDAEWQRLQEVLEQLGSNNNLDIDPSEGITLEHVKNRSRHLKKTKGLDYVIIDYLQLMDLDGLKGGNREQQIGSCTRALKALAKELGIPIIFLSQLSRAVETRGGSKRPQLSDLRESGNIENDCDIVVFIYRPEYYSILEGESGENLQGVAELIVAKYRDGAPCTAKVGYNSRLTKFMDLRDGAFDGPPQPEPNRPDHTPAFTVALPPSAKRGVQLDDIPF